MAFKLKYPQPLHHQDFEALVADLWTDHSGHGAHPYGRSGQTQHGIDVIGKDCTGRIDVAIQCKHTQLTTDMIDQEYAKVLAIPSSLHRVGMMYIFTTSPRDTVLQSHATVASSPHPGLPLELWFWEDINEYLNQHPPFAQVQYPHFAASDNDPALHVQWLHLAFNRPAWTVPLPMEVSWTDLMDAVKDTLIFLNTGVLNNRSGQPMSPSMSSPAPLRYTEYTPKYTQEIGELVRLIHEMNSWVAQRGQQVWYLDHQQLRSFKLRRNRVVRYVNGIVRQYSPTLPAIHIPR